MLSTALIFLFFNIMEKDMKITAIGEGMIFECIKDVVMWPSGGTTYLKGKWYLSERDECITNEQGDKGHYWNADNLFRSHFLLLSGAELYARCKVNAPQPDVKDAPRIIKGMFFRCLKDVVMDDETRTLAYLAGNVYESERDGCITDKQGDVGHLWSANTWTDEFIGVERFDQYFEPWDKQLNDELMGRNDG